MIGFFIANGIIMTGTNERGVVERSFIKHMDVLINILFGGYVFEYVKIVLKLFDGNDVKVEEDF